MGKSFERNIVRFSVIIPCYNNEKWLRKCLTSVLTQSFQDFEIIFVDDMSTDSCGQIAREMLRPCDTIITNKTKRLNGGSRNEAIAIAKGEYTICLDSDDWLLYDRA